MPRRPIVRAVPARFAESATRCGADSNSARHPVRVLDRDVTLIEREDHVTPIVRCARQFRFEVFVDRVTDVLLQRIGRIAVQRPEPLERVRDVKLNADPLSQGS